MGVTTQAGIPLDPSTGAVAVIDYAHHEIHSGSHYLAGHFATIQSGASLDLQITAPSSSKGVHLIARAAASDIADLYFYEGATSTGGTPVSALNRNRFAAASKPATATVVHTPSVSAVGTQLAAYPINGSKTGSGEVRDAEEWVLLAGTKYLLRVTSGANANKVAIAFDWYEHTPRPR